MHYVSAKQQKKQTMSPECSVAMHDAIKEGKPD